MGGYELTGLVLGILFFAVSILLVLGTANAQTGGYCLFTAPALPDIDPDFTTALPYDSRAMLFTGTGQGTLWYAFESCGREYNTGGLACGAGPGQGQNKDILYSSDGGSTWNQLDLYKTYNLFEARRTNSLLYRSSDQTIWAATEIAGGAIPIPGIFKITTTPSVSASYTSDVPTRVAGQASSRAIGIAIIPAGQANAGIYAVADRAGSYAEVYKSANDGATWAYTTSALPNRGVNIAAQKILATSTIPSHLYVGTSDGRVYISNDGGTAWTDTGIPVSPAPDCISRVHDIMEFNGNVYVSGRRCSGSTLSGVFKRGNTATGSEAWTQLPAIPNDFQGNSVTAMHGTGTSTLYVGTDPNTNVYVTQNDGTTWKPVNIFPNAESTYYSPNPIASIRTDPNGLLYVATSLEGSSTISGRLYKVSGTCNPANLVAIANTFCSAWAKTTDLPANYIGNIFGPMRASSYSTAGPTGTIFVGGADNNGARIDRSTDDGASWPGRFNGADAAEFSPTLPSSGSQVRAMVATSGGGEVYAATWVDTAPASDGSAIYRLPTPSSAQWVKVGGTLPDKLAADIIQAGSFVFFVTGAATDGASSGGIWRTPLGGSAWTVMTNPPAPFSQVSPYSGISTIEPITVSGTPYLYLGTDDGYIFRSTQDDCTLRNCLTISAGNSWVKMTDILIGGSRGSILDTIGSGGTIYALVSKNSGIYVYKSSDGGSNWSPAADLPGSNLGASGYSVSGIKLFADASGIIFVGSSLAGNLFASNDQGTTWKFLGAFRPDEIASFLFDSVGPSQKVFLFAPATILGLSTGYSAVCNSDMVPPTYSWSTPASNQYFRNNTGISIDVGITDPAVSAGMPASTSCNFLIDGGASAYSGAVSYTPGGGSPPTTATCSGVISVNLAGGTKSLTVQVADSSGNSQLSPARNIIIDTAFPSYAWVNPPAGQAYRNTHQVPVLVTITDNGDFPTSQPLPDCDIEVTDPALNPILAGFTKSITYTRTGAGTATCSGSITITSMTSGTYYMTVNVTDLAGNSRPSSARGFDVDNFPPGYAWNQPVPSTSSGPYYKNGAVIPIDARADDAIPSAGFPASQPLVNCDIKIDRNTVGFTPSVAYTNLGFDAVSGTYAATCIGTITITPGLTDGEHNITVNVTDALGNSARSQNRSIRIDNNAPRVQMSIDDPIRPGAPYTRNIAGLIKIYLNMDDWPGSGVNMNSCRFANTQAGLAAAPSEPCPATSATPKAWILANPESEGDKIVWINVSDNARNVNITNDTITLDYTPPTLYAYAPTGCAYVEPGPPRQTCWTRQSNITYHNFTMQDISSTNPPTWYTSRPVVSNLSFVLQGSAPGSTACGVTPGFCASGDEIRSRATNLVPLVYLSPVLFSDVMYNDNYVNITDVWCHDDNDYTRRCDNDFGNEILRAVWNATTSPPPSLAEQNYTIWLATQDGANNTNPGPTGNNWIEMAGWYFKTDNSPPVITITATSSPSGVNAVSTWTNESVTVSASCTDSRSGCDPSTLLLTSQFRTGLSPIDCSTRAYTVPGPLVFSVSINSNYSICARARDRVGNLGYALINVNQENVFKPVVNRTEVTPVFRLNKGNYTNQTQFNVSWDGYDPLPLQPGAASGLRDFYSVQFSERDPSGMLTVQTTNWMQSGAPVAPTTGRWKLFGNTLPDSPEPVKDNYTYNFSVTARDVAGNIGGMNSTAVIVDITKPACTVSVQPQLWVNANPIMSDIIVTGQLNDGGSGVQHADINVSVSPAGCATLPDYAEAATAGDEIASINRIYTAADLSSGPTHGCTFTFTCQPVDNVGNVGPVPASVSTTVDAEPPEASSSLEVGLGEWTNKQQFDVNWTGSTDALG
ncbi:MAG: hypothetical protein HY518_01640, partial [Candidatus Aenigmarchaeota archaeon]|nr:hypothetical protein [Candidatus Aenigmarchaeota archaeon]